MQTRKAIALTNHLVGGKKPPYPRKERNYVFIAEILKNQKGEIK